VIESPARTAWYVYGVVAADDDDARRALAHTGRGVVLVESDSVAALVSAVPLDEFDETALAENLNDRAWLERNARAHEDVLQAVAATTDVVPLRFGTICRGRDDVRALLEARRSALEADLARIRGSIELGVKVWVDRERAVAPSISAATGRGYLEQRRDAQTRARDFDARCREVVRSLYERLLEHAVEGVANRPQPRELTGRREEMLLNAAFLVRAGDGAIPAVAARANDELAELGIGVELTGPWPPHNFVGAPEVVT
jgi:gas vesicle protein GvpL/GvpF